MALFHPPKKVLQPLFPVKASLPAVDSTGETPKATCWGLSLPLQFWLSAQMESFPLPQPCLVKSLSGTEPNHGNHEEKLDYVSEFIT